MLSFYLKKKNNPFYLNSLSIFKLHKKSIFRIIFKIKRKSNQTHDIYNYEL